MAIMETFRTPQIQLLLKTNWTIMVLELSKLNGIPILIEKLRLLNVTRNLKLTLCKINSFY